MSARPDALLTFVVTEEGKVEIEPGALFGPEHLDLLVDASNYLQEAVRDRLN